MRSVQRGPWPTGNDGSRISFRPYQKAKDPLIQRIGEYCSYCERPGDLDVEHVIPKSVATDLETEWSNLLLGCRNCNSRKSNKNHSRDGYLWPDRDDTFNAFVYNESGRVSVNEGLAEDEHRSKALALFNLVERGAQGSPTDKRHRKRREAWNQAVCARCRIRDAESRDLAVLVALGTGFFSVWMTVFHDDGDMRQRLTAAFPGTWLE
ncbi:MAG: HNH endonuclease [Cyanobacteria bacterium MAG CAR3_bin_5]|nr:HNH endonuclease [Cyanobacteria bacterium MAG CAR3_bin_5]